MKMEVLAVQQQYQTQYGVLGSNKVKDWTSTLTPPSSTLSAATNASNQSNSSLLYLQSSTTNKRNTKLKSSINKQKSINRTSEMSGKIRAENARNIESSYQTTTTTSSPTNITNNNNNLFYCDDIDAAAVNELSVRLLNELRLAKQRHLTCTEVSLPCDLTPRIAAEIIRVSAKEPCGLRGCTIYIEFEDEPNNSRRIATLKLDPEMPVSTFELYLTLRQDNRGWTALLPQFMKSLARSTITISPEFTITKHKLYSPQQSSYSYNYNHSSTAAISTPTS